MGIQADQTNKKNSITEFFFGDRIFPGDRIFFDRVGIPTKKNSITEFFLGDRIFPGDRIFLGDRIFFDRVGIPTKKKFSKSRILGDRIFFEILSSKIFWVIEFFSTVWEFRRSENFSKSRNPYVVILSESP